MPPVLPADNHVHSQWSYDTFGRVPKAGESRQIDGFRIVVERVRRRRIERVYFERIAAEAPAE